MKILVISQYFWPENFRINELVKDLQSRGHKITVFTGLPNYPNGKIFSGYCKYGWRTDNYDGIIVKRVPLIARGSGSRVRLAFNYLSFVFFSCISAPFSLRDKYDVIFVYEPSPITVCLPAILIKKIKKTSIILWVQDLWPESLSATGAVKSASFVRLVSYLVKYIYHACDLILVQSNAFISSITRLGIDEKKINYFPNSAEKLYRPISSQEINNSFDLPEGFRIIFAGNIGSAQSIGTILEAASILKYNTSIQWIIIGDGRKKRWLEDKIEEKQLKASMHLVGYKPLDDMPYYFAKADVLLATLRREPIFSLTVPSKIQSYLACGKPIVAAIDGETARVIEDSGGGISVSAESAEELAAAILCIFNMSVEERIEMGTHGRKYFEDHFDSTKLVDQLEKWMLKLSLDNE